MGVVLVTSADHDFQVGQRFTRTNYSARARVRRLYAVAEGKGNGLSERVRGKVQRTRSNIEVVGA